MQLVANQQLVKNRVRLGLGFHVTALVVFALGLVLSTQIDATRELPWESWVAILAGLGLYSLGQTQLRRWGPRNRQEEQLGQAIRSLDDRYKLYAFLSSSLPDYILVSPAGRNCSPIALDWARPRSLRRNPGMCPYRTPWGFSTSACRMR